MSSVLHPVGPEPEQTYWIRRGLVLGTALLLVVLLIALFTGGSNSGSAVAAAPSPPPGTQVSTAATPSASPVPTPSASGSPSSSPEPSSDTDRAGGTTSPSPTPSPTSTSASPNTKSTAKSKTSTSKPAGPATCSPAELRATLTGKQELKPKQSNTFKLSLINGSDTTCVVKVTGADFELKIYSGTDRIWSSDDCSTAVKAISKKVAAEDAVEWSMTWDGRRSKKDCKDRPEIPQPGTYFATAQLDGAKPVQLRMIVRG